MAVCVDCVISSLVTRNDNNNNMKINNNTSSKTEQRKIRTAKEYSSGTVKSTTGRGGGKGGWGGAQPGSTSVLSRIYILFVHFSCFFSHMACKCYYTALKTPLAQGSDVLRLFFFI